MVGYGGDFCGLVQSVHEVSSPMTGYFQTKVPEKNFNNVRGLFPFYYAQCNSAYFVNWLVHKLQMTLRGLMCGTETLDAESGNGSVF